MKELQKPEQTIIKIQTSKGHAQELSLKSKQLGISRSDYVLSVLEGRTRGWSPPSINRTQQF